MNEFEIYTCSEMARHIAEGEVALTYIPKFREFGIKVLDGGESIQSIHCCPWCGKSLPKSLRDKWFERLDLLGLEPGDPAIPEELCSEVWWQKEGL